MGEFWWLIATMATSAHLGIAKRDHPSLRQSGDDQFEALKQAQSGYFLAILIIQTFNLFAVKASSRLPVGSSMWNNPKTWIGLFSGATLAFLAVFTSPANAVLLTSSALNPVYLLIPMAAGVLLFVYATVRRLVLHHVSGTRLLGRDKATFVGRRLADLLDSTSSAPFSTTAGSKKLCNKDVSGLNMNTSLEELA